MKAIIYSKYGPPDILELKEVEKPVPTDGQVLLKVCAAAANPADLAMKGGVARLVLGLRKPRESRLGIDIAGQVEAIGNKVTRFHPGDEVFGRCTGAFAEYASAREDQLVLKPVNLSFEQAAAVPVAAITALQGLRDKGHIQSGQKVLINGASGGVGTFAVQIAKSYGTQVTGVCSTQNLDLVRSIGADHVIDYTREDFTRGGQHYDLIYDAVGNHSVSDCMRVLSPQGICVIAGYSTPLRLFEHAVLGPMMSTTGKKQVGLMGLARVNQKDLAYLKELIETGKVVPVIDRRYTLSEVPEALRYLGERHARGKVVIAIEQNGK